MRKWICVLFVSLVATLPLAAVSKHDAAFIGGTASIAKDVTGVLSADDHQDLSFHWDNNMGFGDWRVSYQRISAVSYSQHIGKSMMSAIKRGVTTLGVGAVPIFPKKRQHYLAIEFADENGVKQTAVFEVGKDAIEPLLAAIESRTGKKVAYEDDDERKNAGK